MTLDGGVGSPQAVFAAWQAATGTILTAEQRLSFLDKPATRALARYDRITLLDAFTRSQYLTEALEYVRRTPATGVSRADDSKPAVKARLTPEDLLVQYEHAGRTLTGDERDAFLTAPEVTELCTLDRAAVAHALTKAPTLAQAVGLARFIVAQKAASSTGKQKRRSPTQAKKSSKPTTTGKATKASRGASAKSRKAGAGASRSATPKPRRVTNDGPGATGFSGGLGRAANRAPIFDPHQRFCGSCGALEVACKC